MKSVVALTLVALLLLLPPNTLIAATFGEVTETFSDGSERIYTIRFLDDGRECIWSGPSYSNCPSGCLASTAPPLNIPTCISLCGGWPNLICPWE